MNSEREIELKSFMNSFIKSPSFPKLRKSNLKNNESNNDPSERATAVNKKSYISNIAENWKKYGYSTDFLIPLCKSYETIN